jgi:hypothetical protein
MTHAEIIQKLGGAPELSRLFGTSRSAASNWLRAGIPAKYWPDVVRLAQERNIPGITFEALKVRPAQAA